MPAHRIAHSRFDVRGGHTATAQLLDTPEPPTAVFAVNDFAAIGALRDQGLRAGTDVAVVGFNDTPPAAELPLPLATVRSPMLEMGRRGLRLPTRLLEGEPVESERLRPELVVRASSAPRP